MTILKWPVANFPWSASDLDYSKSMYEYYDQSTVAVITFLKCLNLNFVVKFQIKM